MAALRRWHKGAAGRNLACHHGVLFLDELPEFQPQVLACASRSKPAKSRSRGRTTASTRFQLVAAMNPCRCGHANEPGFACSRQSKARCVAQYQARLSGPLLDRIDLHVDVPAIAAADLTLPPPAEGSREVAERVAAAQDIQIARYAGLGHPGIVSNAAAPAYVIEAIAQPDARGLALIKETSERLHLSARGFHRILKLARTIADLDGAAEVGRTDLADALTYHQRRNDAASRRVNFAPS
jgi:magnesium chelatase family protein